jgi:hypothetical protein
MNPRFPLSHRAHCQRPKKRPKVKVKVKVKVKTEVEGDLSIAIVDQKPETDPRSF